MQRLQNILDRVYLIYLGVLPALATFALVHQNHYHFFVLLLVGGTVVVSLYLVTIVLYTQRAQTSGTLIVHLLDGPLAVLLSHPWQQPSFSFAIDIFMVEGLAVWGGILWTAILSSAGDLRDKVPVYLFGILGICAQIFLFWPYIQQTIWGDWNRLFWLIAGAVEAVVMYHRIYQRDQSVREEDQTTPYILVFLILWVFALIAANVLREMGI